MCVMRLERNCRGHFNISIVNVVIFFLRGGRCVGFGFVRTPAPRSTEKHVLVLTKPILRGAYSSTVRHPKGGNAVLPTQHF